MTTGHATGSSSLSCTVSRSHYLEGLSEPFTVYTDHQTLQYFQTSRMLSRRLPHWSQAVNHHKNYVVYRPGRQNTLCDALSRRAEHAVGCGTADLETSAVLRPIFSYPLYLSLPLPLLVRHEDPSRTVASIAMKIAVEIHLELALKPVHDPCSRQRSKISWTVDF